MAHADAPPVKIHPPALSVMAPAMALLLEWLIPVHILPSFGFGLTAVCGVLLLLFSGWLAIAGERAFKQAGTNVDPRQPSTAIVTDGPYRFTRNPMYLGMVVLQFGLALTFSLDWALIGGVIVWTCLNFLVVPYEEEYLKERFGAPYIAYLSRVRRWL